MALNEVFGSSIFLRRSASVQRRRTKQEVNLDRRSRLPFSAFSFSPKVLYSPLSFVIEYEQRLVSQPIIKFTQFVSRSANETILRSLFQVFSRESIDRPTQKRHTPRKKSRRSRNEAKKLFEKGLVMERQMDFDGAIANLKRATELDPNNVVYLAQLSKQYTDMSFAPHVTDEQAKELNLKALELAERAVILNPTHVIGHIARGVSKGRLAYFCDNKQKIALAKEAEEAVREAIEVDKNCDIGHHLLGRFQYEMAGLNVFHRAFVRMVYGATLRPGSYVKALEAFQKAEKLNPNRAVHKVLLGKTYLKLGKKELALEAFKDALMLDEIDINDHLEKIDGRRILKKIEKH